MKIGLTAVFTQRRHGMQRVAEELLQRLVKMPHLETITILVSTKFSFLLTYLEQSNKIKLSTVRISKKPWQVFKLWQFLIQEKFIVVLDAPSLFNFILLFFKKFTLISKPVIIQLIPDFVSYRYPDTLPILTNIFYRLERIIKNSVDCFIVISESTKKDMMRFWKVKEDKIKVMPLASFISVKKPRRNFGNKKILFVGTIEPRKNVNRLLDAFLLVKKEIADAELILVGQVGWMVNNLMKKIESLKNKGVKYLGALPDEKVEALYTSVDIFVYLSLYEGFGLPVLEAMACGCPVIASNSPSIKEIAEEVAILVNPKNMFEIKQVIKDVLSDQGLKEELSKKGIERAKKYSWDKSFDIFWKIIKDNYNENSN